MVAKLQYKYYGTKMASDFISNSTTNIIKNFINRLNEKVDPNGEISQYLTSVSYDLSLKKAEKKNDFIQPQEIVLGYKVVKDKKKNQSMYYVPIAKSVKLSLEKFNLNTEKAKIAIYLDEISLVNPIGNCIENFYFKHI